MRTGGERGAYGPIAAVIGWPVGHSLSPVLHRYWLQEQGVDGEYVALAVSPARLAEAVQGLAALGFVGANVTIPHKTAVIALCERIDPLARRVGAANLILRDERGRWLALNSDVAGIKAALAGGQSAWELKAQQALLLGAGGAARAVVVALLDLGVGRVVIANRHRERAAQLADDLRDDRIAVISWHERSHALRDSRLLVNATSLGMAGFPPLTIDLSLMPEDGLVFDLVYRPVTTPLLQEAQRRGLRAIDGLQMLIHQAAPAFEAFYGVAPRDLAGARRLLLDRLSDKKE